MIWAAVLAGAAGCYAAKLAGLSLPSRVLSSPRVQQVASQLPIALLAALVVTQTFTTRGAFVIDARAAGLAVALVAVALRAPFLLVVVAATATAAVVRVLA